MNEKKCIPIEHANLMPGWGCCQCNTYNGNHREKCKFCEHVRCYFPKVEIESTATFDELDVLLDTELPDIFANEDTGGASYLVKKKLLN